MLGKFEHALSTKLRPSPSRTLDYGWVTQSSKKKQTWAFAFLNLALEAEGRRVSKPRKKPEAT